MGSWDVGLNRVKATVPIKLLKTGHTCQLRLFNCSSVSDVNDAERSSVSSSFSALESRGTALADLENAEVSSDETPLGNIKIMEFFKNIYCI